MDETKTNRDKRKAVVEDERSLFLHRDDDDDDDEKVEERRTETKRMEEGEEDGGRGRGCGLGYLGPQTNRRWCPPRCHRLPNTDAAFWRATSTCTGSRLYLVVR